MPKVVKVVKVGFLTVKLRERMDHEGWYATRFSVQTFDDEDHVTHLHDCAGYGDDEEYIMRKFDAVVENVRQLVSLFVD